MWLVIVKIQLSRRAKPRKLQLRLLSRFFFQTFHSISESRLHSDGRQGHSNLRCAPLFNITFGKFQQHVAKCLRPSMSADARSYQCSSFVCESDTEGPWLCARRRPSKERLRDWRPRRHKRTPADGALHCGGRRVSFGDSDYSEDSMFGPESGYKSYRPIKIHRAAPWRAATVSYLSQPEWNERWWHRGIDSQHICIFLKDRCSLLIDPAPLE